MKRPIYLTNEKKKSIQKELRVSRITTWRALSGILESSVDFRIRNRAIELGGQYLYNKPGFCPNCETSFEHEDGQVRLITQKYPNDVTMVMDFVLGVASVYDGDRLRASIDDVTDWPQLIFEAQVLSDSKEGM